jgi:hypothetical protein
MPGHPRMTSQLLAVAASSHSHPWLRLLILVVIVAAVVAIIVALARRSRRNAGRPS